MKKFLTCPPTVSAIALRDGGSFARRLMFSFLLLSSSYCYPMSKGVTPLLSEKSLLMQLPELPDELGSLSAASSSSIDSSKITFLSDDHKEAYMQEYKGFFEAVAKYQTAQKGGENETTIISLVQEIATKNQRCTWISEHKLRWPPVAGDGFFEFRWPPSSGLFLPLAKLLALSDGELKNSSGEPIACWPPVSGPAMDKTASIAPSMPPSKSGDESS